MKKKKERVIISGISLCFVVLVLLFNRTANEEEGINISIPVSQTLVTILNEEREMNASVPFVRDTTYFSWVDVKVEANTLAVAFSTGENAGAAIFKKEKDDYKYEQLFFTNDRKISYPIMQSDEASEGSYFLVTKPFEATKGTLIVSETTEVPFHSI